MAQISTLEMCFHPPHLLLVPLLQIHDKWLWVQKVVASYQVAPNTVASADVNGVVFSMHTTLPARWAQMCITREARAN